MPTYIIKRGGVWAWDAYLDDYVDGHFAAQDNDMGKYMQWLAGRLSAWLIKTWPAGWTPPAGPGPARQAGVHLAAPPTGTRRGVGRAAQPVRRATRLGQM